MDNKELQPLPSGLIDALLRFAMDPTQWDSFARELDARGQALSGTDPSSFLTALSQAESLAWQIRNEPSSGLSGCAYFLLAEDGRVLQNNTQWEDLEDYCRVVDGHLKFSEVASAMNFQQSLHMLRENPDSQTLVELHHPNLQSRFGYMVTASNLPAALTSGIPEERLTSAGRDVQFGLLVAQRESGEKTRRVLQSSFHLTTAEMAVCQRLSSGLQLKDVAQSLGISTNTARNHLQAVFDKTGINRQSDLILMMTQLSVVLAVLGDGAPAEVDKQAYGGHHFVILKQESATPRRIAFRRYGNGSRTIVFCHESAGSSRLPPGTDALATKLGLTILAPERPGSGFSDPLDHYTFSNTAEDIAYLLTDLGIAEVHLLGYLSGAGHALAAAAHLDNQVAGVHVKSISLVSGRAPAPFPAAERSPLAVLRRRLVEQPWLLSTFFNIVKSRATTALVRRIILGIYGAAPDDRAFLQAHPEILDHIVGSVMENLTVSAAGIVGEIRCFANAVPVAVSSIHAPLTVWHGRRDNVADYNNLADTLYGVPHQRHIFDDAGTMVLYQHWDKILQSFSR